MTSRPRQYCASCRKELALDTKKPGRSDECPHCSAELHACLNCQHYDPRMAKGCREPQAGEGIRDAERANFCEWFDFRIGPPQDGGRQDSKSAEQAFASLFGGGKSESDPAKDEAAKKFDQLFKRR